MHFRKRRLRYAGVSTELHTDPYGHTTGTIGGRNVSCSRDSRGNAVCYELLRRDSVDVSGDCVLEIVRSLAKQKSSVVLFRRVDEGDGQSTNYCRNGSDNIGRFDGKAQGN